MSDDLVKRLRDLHEQATVEKSHFYAGKCVKDAIERIEELEAKLAEAVNALDVVAAKASKRANTLRGSRTIGKDKAD